MIECEFRIYEDGEYLCQNKMMGEPIDLSCDNCVDDDGDDGND